MSKRSKLTPLAPPGVDPPPKRQKISKKAPKVDNDTRIKRSAIRVVQTQLDNILRDARLKQEITSVCLSMHKLAIHAYQFLALYYTHLLANHSPVQVLTEIFIKDVIRLIAYHLDTSKTPRRSERDQDPQRQQCKAFFEQHYKPTMAKDKIDFEFLSQSITYLATDILTAFENNIKMHYKDYLDRFLQVLFKVKQAPNKQARKEIYKVISQHRKLIKAGKIGQFPEGSVLIPHAASIVPQRPLRDNSLNYDIAWTPQDYLPCMFYIQQFLESNEAKLFALFPMRTSIISKSIRIDTSILINRFLTDEQLSEFGRDTPGKMRKRLTNAVNDNAERIWGMCFKTNLKCFAPPRNSNAIHDDNITRFKFDRMIITDGFSCSIQHRLKHDDLKYQGVDDPKKIPTVPYLESLSTEERMAYQSYNVVGIDPGKQDLLYCAMPKDVASDKRKHGRLDGVEKLRYSAVQRKVECQTVKRRRRMDKLVKNGDKIEGKTVEQWQHELYFYTKKTTSFDKLKAYVTKKNEVNNKLIKFWASDVFRKMKWQSKREKRRSEDKFMSSFKQKFGSPADTLVAIGDWCENKPRKFTEPTKGKSFRGLFKKHGYELFLINEFRTSKYCYNCHEETDDHFLDVKNPVAKKEWKCQCPWDEKCQDCIDWEAKRKPLKRKEYREKIKCHGLLMCKTCKQYWNRDLNGALNMAYIARTLISGGERPAHLSRRKEEEENSSSSAEEANQKTEGLLPPEEVVIVETLDLMSIS